MSRFRIPVITGPTASGKSGLALAMREFADIEIISADAYQVYRHMDIGTAKPDAAELSLVPHHLINILNPNEVYSAGVFFEHAERIIADVLARGRVPVIAGGTGLYVETLQKGIFGGPGRDEDIRRELTRRAQDEGLEALYDELARLDPAYAAKIHKNDPTRIFRGLEVYRILGISLTEAHRTLHVHPRFSYEVFVLERDRSELYSLINRRVDAMVQAGWKDEVERILSMGYDPGAPALKAIGYPEMIACLRGELSLAEAAETAAKKTRNFAKRQLTWFRHMEGIKRVPAGETAFGTICNYLENIRNLS